MHSNIWLLQLNLNPQANLRPRCSARSATSSADSLSALTIKPWSSPRGFFTLGVTAPFPLLLTSTSSLPVRIVVRLASCKCSSSCLRPVPGLLLLQRLNSSCASCWRSKARDLPGGHSVSKNAVPDDTCIRPSTLAASPTSITLLRCCDVAMLRCCDVAELLRSCCGCFKRFLRN